MIDSLQIGEQVACELLAPLFAPTSTTTVILHDLHMDAVALHRHGIRLNECNVLDTQLLHEHLHGDLHVGLSRFLEANRLPKHELKGALKKQMERDVDGAMWAKRPLDKRQLEYAVLDVLCLSCMIPQLTSTYALRTLALVRAASAVRALNASNGDGARLVSFDCDNDYRLCSYELLVASSELELESQDVDKEHVINSNSSLLAQKLHTDETSMDALTELIPDKFQDLLATPEQRYGLMDVVLDKRRRPQAFFGEKRMFLVEDKSVVVEQEDIEGIVQQLGESNIGSDNRVGMDGSLNRISVIRNPKKCDSIIGLTMRVGRAITGNATMIYDLLFSPAFREKSILVVGEPGSGKTTIVREIARVLAEEQNVCIVDTSNEIAGDGDVPHQCVGLARRMMVPSLDTQCQVMVECVQNHTPHVMVIDEIGRPKEVDAARTVKQRGVRIVASAHGSFRSMMKNKQLKGLLGGFEQVIKTGGVPKTERVSAPTFEVVIEVQRKSYHQWVVIPDVDKAVDSVLLGAQYQAQVRLRDPDSPGKFNMTLAKH